MAESLITEVTADSIQALLRELGWQTTLAGTKDAPQVVSAVNGVNFNVRFGTEAKGKRGWTDFTISAPFSVDQEISPYISVLWNRRNRFARVYRTDTQIFLDMDVVVSGGVGKANLKYQFAVWSDIARLFVRHLKADHAVLARYKASRESGGVRPPAPAAPKQDTRSKPSSVAQSAGKASSASGRGNGKSPDATGAKPA